MAYFVDSSVLVKLYHQEADSSRYRALIVPLAKQGEVLIADLAQVELVSAFTKLVRMGKLSRVDLEVIVRAIAASQVDFRVLSQSDNILARATALLLKYAQIGLRTLDALQLSYAIEHRQHISVFISADHLLSECARLEDFATEPV